MITPPDEDFMRVLYLVEIYDNFTIAVIHDWDTSIIECGGRSDGETRINLYKHIIDNQKLGNQFKFAVNSDKDLAIGFVKRED